MFCGFDFSHRGSNPFLGIFNLLFELVFELLGHLNLSVLGNRFLHLTIHFHLHQVLFIISRVWDLKDAAIVLALEVTVPQATRLPHELVLQV